MKAISLLLHYVRAEKEQIPVARTNNTKKITNVARTNITKKITTVSLTKTMRRGGRRYRHKAGGEGNKEGAS